MKNLLVTLIFSWCTVVIGQDFRPNVYVQCIDGVLAVTVQTDDPFLGVIYPENHREKCAEYGIGKLRTSLLIPLTGRETCGVVYKPWEEQYFALVNVRQHPMIILQQDRTFNVSCPREGGIERRNESNPQSIQMGLYSRDKFINIGVFGQPYQLRVWTSSTEDKFTVSTCMGFAGTNHSIQLTDSIGCSVNPELVGNFDYDEILNTATAPIQSLFKFPFFNLMHIQCAVVFCPQNKCKRVDCERRRSLLQDYLTSQNDGRRVGELRQSRFASTTITVEEIGEISKQLHESTCPYYTQLMAALCILFAALFAGALIINLAFCALGGYCCCEDDGTSSLSTLEYLNHSDKSASQSKHLPPSQPFTVYDIQRHHASATNAAYVGGYSDPIGIQPVHHSPASSYLSEISHNVGQNDRFPLIKVVDADNPTSRPGENFGIGDQDIPRRKVNLAGINNHNIPVHIDTHGTAF